MKETRGWGERGTVWTPGEVGTGTATFGVGRGEGHTLARARTKPRGRVSAPSWLRVPAAGHVTAQASVSPRVKQEASKTGQSERGLRVPKNHRGPRPPQVNFPAAPRGWGFRPRASSRGDQACPRRPPSRPRRAAPTRYWPRPLPPTVHKSAPAQTPAPCRPPGRRREGRGRVW